MTHADLARPARRTRVLVPLALAALVILAAAGCDGSVAASATASPVSSDTASREPVPEPTRWPPSAVSAVVALGAADAEIWDAGTDFGLAAETQDLELMWGAADGLAKLIEGLTPNIEKLEAYPHTKPLGDRYRAAFPVLHEGATMIREAIDQAVDGGDPDDLTAGSRRLAEGLRLYGEVRALLADESYVEQAVTQQRLLLN